VLSDGDGNPRQVIDSSGNGAIAGVPAAWAATNINAWQVNTVGLANNGGSTYLMHNSHQRSGYNPYYTTSGYASGIYFNSGGSGGIFTYTAGSGTAGTAVSFTAGPYIANLGTSWTNSSDERLKNITGEIQNGLAKVCTLRAAEYTWKNSENNAPQVGLIAQDVLAVLPQVVVVSDKEFDGTAETAMGINYDQVIPLLVAAIKEQQAIIESLKARLDAANL
jgi:hypothetical protein